MQPFLCRRFFLWLILVKIFPIWTSDFSKIFDSIVCEHSRIVANRRLTPSVLEKLTFRFNRFPLNNVSSSIMKSGRKKHQFKFVIKGAFFFISYVVRARLDGNSFFLQNIITYTTQLSRKDSLLRSPTFEWYRKTIILVLDPSWSLQTIL